VIVIDCHSLANHVSLATDGRRRTRGRAEAIQAIHRLSTAQRTSSVVDRTSTRADSNNIDLSSVEL